MEAEVSSRRARRMPQTLGVALKSYRSNNEKTNL